ncbi:Iron-regulated protein A [termite gut metagenome]|uniref:Iron-regulated protein A n=1 Tax=termite gut metagenome TaxID=433724 RepID=A0A5J4SG05_9ZZZZ
MSQRSRWVLRMRECLKDKSHKHCINKHIIEIKNIMKRIFRYLALTFLVTVALPLSFTSCEDDDNDIINNDELYQSILEEYVNKTVVPTYKELAEAALVMRTANIALKTEPTNAAMQAASGAWMRARVAWEISEAFLFGPVGENALDIDGHIDSWPLELSDIQAEIAKGGNLTGAEAWNKEGDVIGFHVTEYLLYRDGQSRPVGDLPPAELSYLVAATDALVWDCVLAYVAWVGEENVSSEMKAVFRENPAVVAHLNANPNFKNFADRLTTKTGYPSWGAALNEIASGAADIAGEVGATKIEQPYESGNVEEVESWYSWHSLDDYQNNIRSIKNAYLGGRDDNSRTAISLSSYIKKQNSELDTNIKSKIEDCLSKIAAIGTGEKSFYEVVRDKKNNGANATDGARVNAAVDACAKLEELFSSIANIID